MNYFECNKRYLQERRLFVDVARVETAKIDSETILRIISQLSLLQKYKLGTAYII